jgi:hypothetical protein
MSPDDSSSWVMKSALPGTVGSKHFGLCAATYRSRPVAMAYSQSRLDVRGS